MAAEEAGRVCYGSDLEPKYVDVAVRRWQEARTGRDAILASTSETFAARELAHVPPRRRACRCRVMIASQCPDWRWLQAPAEAHPV